VSAARRLTPTAARRLGLSACAGIALSTLPLALFPWPWFAALLLPASLSLPLARLRAFERIAVLAALQIGALYAAQHAAGPLHRLAALAGTLLPPLCFLALRAEPLDVLRGVFLAFCVLLIGAILGEPSGAQLLGFVAVAVLTLLADVSADAAEDRASVRTARAGVWRRLAGAAHVVVACGIAFVLSLHALRALPAPGLEDRPASAGPAAPAGTARVGPSAEFDFGNVGGSLLALRSDRLVAVRSGDGRPVPTDLYLRCAHFDVAGLDGWDVRSPRFRPLARREDGRAVVGRLDPDRPVRQLGIELFETSAGLAYVPPGTLAILGADGLVGDLGAGVFRFDEPRPQAAVDYAVAYQPVRDDSVEDLPDARRAGLTEIGPDLRRWRPMFEDILAGPAVRREIEPMRIARAIAAELQTRCSYALREPVGPHRHSILNFLDGSREGFCMHFASVTAICLRLAGIPARIGAGLYGGGASDEDYGTRIFGSQHAHAWVEIPFADLGWVVFDPTPAAARENLRWIDFGTAEPGAAATAVPGTTARFALRGLDGRWPWLAAALAVAVLVGLRWQRDPRRAGRGPRTSPDVRSARRLLEQLLRALATRGTPRLPGESLERLAARLGPDPGLAAAFAAYQETRFGGQPLDAGRRARLEEAIAAVERADRG
jgi:hypothetical protein